MSEQPTASRRQAGPFRINRTVLLASAHCLIDCSNGNAVATLDLLQALAGCGLSCHAFCTTRLDLP
jgi:hypothetical protein